MDDEEDASEEALFGNLISGGAVPFLECVTFHCSRVKNDPSV